MALRERRGMIIKNVSNRFLEIRMRSRTIQMSAGEEVMVTPEEVRDSTFREHLQVRSVAVVRPTTPEEEEQFKEALRQAYNRQRKGAETSE